MMRSTFVAPLCLAAALALLPRTASAQWTFDFSLGTAFSAPMPLTVSQEGFPDVRLTGRYETKPLHPRQYYAFRIARWAGDAGWLLEEVHHKIYLKNPTDVVQDLEVSHGYNLVTINRGWRRGANVLLVGGGLVITFPHSTIRGKEYPQKTTNYVLSGVTVQGGIGRRFDLSCHFFVDGEAKITASWARIPVVDGHARVPNAALHLLAGAGWEF
jgi:hypothetical protein